MDARKPALIATPYDNINVGSIMDSDDASNQPRWKGSFSRDAEMRGVDVMGFQECGVGETLTYRPKSML